MGEKSRADRPVNPSEGGWAVKEKNRGSSVPLNGHVVTDILASWVLTGGGVFHGDERKEGRDDRITCRNGVREKNIERL